MLQEQPYRTLHTIANQGMNYKEIDKINIRQIIENYINNHYQSSNLREDSFILLAISIILRKRMQKLKLSLQNQHNQIIQSPIKRQKQTKGVKKQQVRREQIIQDNQLLKLPTYLESQENSQLVEEEQISLSCLNQMNLIQLNNEDKQLSEMEVEVQMDELFVNDHREIVKNSELKSNKKVSYATDTKFKEALIDVAEIYQKMMNLSLESQELQEMENIEQIETKHNSRRKTKVAIDKNQKLIGQTLNYKSQFINAEEEELEFSKLALKMEEYFLRDCVVHQKNLFNRQDMILQNLLELLEENNLSDQLLSILNPEDEKYLNHSQNSSKSLLKNRMDDSNDKSLQKQFRVDYHLDQIQEETSHHYTTSMSRIPYSHNVSMYDKPPEEKARYFYNLLVDASKMSNLIIKQNDKEHFGTIVIEQYQN